MKYVLNMILTSINLDRVFLIDRSSRIYRYCTSVANDFRKMTFMRHP